MYNMQSSLWNAYCAYYALYNVWSALWVVGRPVLIEIHSRPHNWSIWDCDLCELNIAPASKMDRAHYSLPINHLRMDVALWCCKWTGLDGIGYLWVGEVKTKSTLRWSNWQRWSSALQLGLHWHRLSWWWVAPLQEWHYGFARGIKGTFKQPPSNARTQFVRREIKTWSNEKRVSGAI